MSTPTAARVSLRRPKAGHLPTVDTRTIRKARAGGARRAVPAAYETAASCECGWHATEPGKGPAVRALVDAAYREHAASAPTPPVEPWLRVVRRRDVGLILARIAAGPIEPGQAQPAHYLHGVAAGTGWVWSLIVSLADDPVRVGETDGPLDLVLGPSPDAARLWAAIATKPHPTSCRSDMR